MTPLNRFLELRFSRRAGTQGSLPVLCHGTAGTYIRTAASGLRGHTISTSADGPGGTENLYHTLHHQLNGDILESGSLPVCVVDGSNDDGGEDEGYRAVGGQQQHHHHHHHRHRHVLKPYEAVWRVTEPVPRVCVVLVLKGSSLSDVGKGGGGGIGMVIRVGSWCQGLMKVAGQVTAERWTKDKTGRWERVVRVGAGLLPCMVACMDRDESGTPRGGRYWRQACGLGFAVEKTVAEGDRVVVEGVEWAVVEKRSW